MYLVLLLRFVDCCPTLMWFLIRLNWACEAPKTLTNGNCDVNWSNCSEESSRQNVCNRDPRLIVDTIVFSGIDEYTGVGMFSMPLGGDVYVEVDGTKTPQLPFVLNLQLLCLKEGDEMSLSNNINSLAMSPLSPIAPNHGWYRRGEVWASSIMGVQVLLLGRPNCWRTPPAGIGLLPLEKDHSKRVRSTVECWRSGYVGQWETFKVVAAST